MKAEFKMLGCTIALIVGEAMAFALPMATYFKICVGFSAILLALLGYGFAIKGWHYVVVGMLGFVLACNTISAHARFYSSLTKRARNVPVRLEVEIERAVKAGLVFAKCDGINLAVTFPRNLPLPKEGERWECIGWPKSRPHSVAERGEIRVFGVGTRMCKIRDVNIFCRLRQALSKRMAIGLEREHDIVDLNRAILLGERAKLDRTIKATFIDAGTMHVFAISGLHVMIIAQVLMFLIMLCGVPYRFVPFALIPMLWGYVMMTGAPSSAVRAALMASFYFSAALFRRQPNALLAWAFAFLLIYAIEPVRFYDVGCALSFAVMLGLLLAGQLVMRIVNGYKQFVLISFAAWCAGMPIAAHVFGRITPAGIIANLLILPIVSFSVVLSFLGAISGFVSTTLAAHLNNFSALFTKAMFGISAAIASLPCANFEIRPWSSLMCVEAYVMMLLVLFLANMIFKRRQCTI